MSATATRLLAREPVAGGWWLVRLAWQGPAPRPGQYLDARLSDRELILPVRAASLKEGWLAALLEPALGGVLESLAVGSTGRCRLLGEGLEPAAAPPGSLLLVGRDGGVGPALAFAEAGPEAVRFAALGGDQGVPGRVQPSRFVTAGLPGEVMGALAGLEGLGVVSRVAHPAGRPGCFEGQPEDLLASYLELLQPEAGRRLGVVAFGPAGMEATLRASLGDRVTELRVVELPG